MERRWYERRDTDTDLGHDHWLRYFGWMPDDTPENRAQFGDPLPRVERAGATIGHLAPNGEHCLGVVMFDLPELRTSRGGHEQYWQVVQAEPLTISPSVECSLCGDHGHVENGRWRPA